MNANQDNYQAMADSDLVIAAQSGNDEAFAELFTRHRLNSVKVATSILKNTDDAEEEVQNSFWKAYTNIQRFQLDAQFTTWLSRIVINQCLMRLRSAKRKRTFSIDDVQFGEGRSTLELRDVRDTPEAKFGREQVVHLMRVEISCIPPVLRDVLVLKDIEERPTVEVAEHLSLTVSAVKSRLLRARRMLRTRLERHQTVGGAATLLAESRA
jgi:RNA polymerase sigma-70 factor (ECF subfamily)